MPDIPFDVTVPPPRRGHHRPRRRCGLVCADVAPGLPPIDAATPRPERTRRLHRWAIATPPPLPGPVPIAALQSIAPRPGRRRRSSPFALRPSPLLPLLLTPIAVLTPPPPAIAYRRKRRARPVPPSSPVYLRHHRFDLRGRYRIFNPPRYRIYRSQAGPPVAGDEPWTESLALPCTPNADWADGTWFVSVSRFDGVLDSGFLPLGPNGETYRTLTLADGVAFRAPPPAPRQLEAVQAGDQVLVTAHYLADGPDRAEQWALASANDGSEPAAAAPTITRDFAQPAGFEIFGQSLAIADAGQPFAIVLQTRRNDGTALHPHWTYSAAIRLSIALTASGPSAPLG